MDWWRPDLIIPVVGAICAGAAVGLEREFRGQPAGLRTHLLVCLASTFLMLLSIEQAAWMARLPHEMIRIDPMRMAHGVLTGVGFLCGGVIFRTGITVHGLTTAASLWITSALGLLFGAELYGLAIGATVIVLAVLALLRVLDDAIPKQAVAETTIRFARDGAPNGPELQADLRRAGIRCANFTQKLTDRGEVIEMSGRLRADRWDDMEHMLAALRQDARVLEYEFTPRKP